jgi:hypothetical protein
MHCWARSASQAVGLLCAQWLRFESESLYRERATADASLIDALPSLFVGLLCAQWLRFESESLHRERATADASLIDALPCLFVGLLCAQWLRFESESLHRDRATADASLMDVLPCLFVTLRTNLKLGQLFSFKPKPTMKSSIRPAPPLRCPPTRLARATRKVVSNILLTSFIGTGD